MSDTRPNAVTIDRLALHAGALSVDEARRLAELVALALARIPMYSPTPVAWVDVRVESEGGIHQVAAVVADAIAAALRAEAAS